MSQVQQVKDATDIIQVIGERIKLNRAGSNFKALCPFHSEKTPSFFVNETLQRYKCFGCGRQGDVITFLEEYEGMTFVEALEQLADQAGITLERFHSNQEDDLKKQVLEVLNLAKEYYHYLLTEHKRGQPGRDYLKERGVTSQSIKLFQLGFALPGWEGLIKYLHHKKKYSLQVLEQAGLVIKGRGSRYYDRFRGRIIFPLKNHRGQVVGFSGRILDPDKKDAKYINSPETIVYHKSEMLYGYSELLQHIRQKKSVIITEGELDVISSTQAHINNVVAVKGSALTQEHIRLLSRVVETVLLALDTDQAGIEATKRAIQLLEKTQLELRVVPLEGGKDPDDLARSKPKIWRELVSKSTSVYDFLLQTALAAHSPSTPEGKRKIMREMAPIINSIPMAVEKDFYVKKMAEALGVKESIVREDLGQQAGGKVNSKLRTRKASEQSQKPTKQEKLERYALFLILHHFDQLQSQKVRGQLSDLEFSSQSHQKISSQLIAHLEEGQSLDLRSLASTLAEDQQQIIFDLYVEPAFSKALEASSFRDEWKQVISQLEAMSVKRKIAVITKQLDELDEVENKTPDQEKLQQELLGQVVALRKKQT